MEDPRLVSADVATSSRHWTGEMPNVATLSSQCHVATSSRHWTGRVLDVATLSRCRDIALLFPDYCFCWVSSPK